LQERAPDTVNDNVGVACIADERSVNLGRTCIAIENLCSCFAISIEIFLSIRVIRIFKHIRIAETQWRIGRGNSDAGNIILSKNAYTGERNDSWTVEKKSRSVTGDKHCQNMPGPMSGGEMISTSAFSRMDQYVW